jgi:RHS repeat-associated protein
MTTDGSVPTSYLMGDGLGSVTTSTDANGNVNSVIAYDAFGVKRGQVDWTNNYIAFAGEQRDNESGFSYLRERYYDPGIGRFLSRDPAGGGYTPMLRTILRIWSTLQAYTG